MPTKKESVMNPKDKEHGEGNYKATQQYNEATKKFVESGKVEDAARDAEPRNQQEAREMTEAEQKGKSHAKDGEAKKPQQQR
jgi:hypothetical protein